VTGKWGDIDGVWIDPVTAQVMMTFRVLMALVLEGSRDEGDENRRTMPHWRQSAMRKAMARPRGRAIGCGRQGSNRRSRKSTGCLALIDGFGAEGFYWGLLMST
jgi:hypothetical protein